MEKMKNDLGLNDSIGSNHYRAFVGPPQKYDIIAASQFNLLTSLGLRENHFLLDIGCGSLRGGRLFIPYLLPQRYFGIEPEQWLIEEGIKNHLGRDILTIKKPKFNNNRNFKLDVFNQKFDFMLAQSIFSHASREQIKTCLQSAKKVMKKNTIFAATFLKGEKNNESDVWLYPQCGTFTLEFLLGLIENQGLYGKSIKWDHPNGQTWIVIVNPENKENFPDL
ncbi:MAG TPA: class I SAM-dependent methyltransferase [Candidatus Paceibacterota bacterium]|nr:class I SAM-dependent methyltransferase [Candidatus Paceibacterota bacterium]